MSSFKETLERKTKEAEEIIKAYLPKEEGSQKTVMEAINYSVKVGGKRLRPILMREAFTELGGQGELIRPFMAALEMIHTYSLIHDDLEAMDNDEYRRGQKTTHVVYGEAMAILAGDGLLNLAFETAANAFLLAPGDTKAEKAMLILGKKAGIYGMVGGQVADIEAEEAKDPLTMEQLLFIHENKTAALIQSALMIGAALAGAEQKQIDEMERIGYLVGVAYQIEDDILDVTGTLEELGKPIGSDEKNHKTTYVTLVGIEKAKEEAERLSEEALDRLHTLLGEDTFLEELIRSLVNRRK